MRSVKNPARSRPLSRNVRRLMKMARESPENPDVEKIEREFTARDLAYCDMPEFLRIPVLLKSPQLIVDVVMWLDGVVSGVDPGESANMAVVRACLDDDGIMREASQDTTREGTGDRSSDALPTDEKALADLYEYAYWLGYIYRCECHMHDESSRMVYGAFNEKFMRDFYRQLSLDDDTALIDCAPEICRRLDVLLVGKLWR